MSDDIIYVSEEEFIKINALEIVDLNLNRLKIVDGIVIKLTTYLSQEELRKKVYGVSELNPNT